MNRQNFIRTTLNFYSGLGWKSLFAKIRFWDAPYLEVEKLISKKGFIVDLGCGEGIFTNFLGIASSNRKVLGIEIDKRRIEAADHGVPNVSFKLGDATKTSFPNVDVIILFHVLHHLNSYAEQEVVIKKCFNELKKDGKLVIVEVEPKLSLKYLIAWLTDHYLVPWIFEKRLYSPIFFRRGVEWVELLNAQGFSCKIIPAERGKPFSHIIFECRKN